jgi:hypothetical protein
MIAAKKIRSIRASVSIAAVFAVMLLAMPARAEDPIFPAGSRIGLVPPQGMALSTNFEGFEDAEKNAAILLATFPADAFAQLDKTMFPEALQKQGIDIETREPFAANAGKGFLLSGKQTTAKGRIRKLMLVAPTGDVTALATVQLPEEGSFYTDKAVRDALATLSVRANVPDAERLSLVPFTVGDLAGFRIDEVLPGRALMLIDATADNGSSDKGSGSSDKGSGSSDKGSGSSDKGSGSSDKGSGSSDKGSGSSDKVSADKNADAYKHDANARFLIAAGTGGPNEAKDRDEFARVTFDQIAGISNVQIQDAEPLRINGQAGYETLASAKDPESGGDLKVVQWLRFGSGGYMQMIGVAHAALWPDLFTRMRTVRDSVEPK